MRKVWILAVVLVPGLLLLAGAATARASKMLERPPPRPPAEAVELDAQGTAAFEAGEVDRARALWRLALRSAEATERRDRAALHLEARLHYQLGDACRLVRDAVRGLAHYRAGWRLFAALGRRDYAARLVHNAGLIHDEVMDDDETALAHYEAAAEVFDEVGDTVDLAVALNSCGAVLDVLGHRREAERCLERVLALSSADPLMRARGLANLGRLHWHAGENHRARELFLEALRIAEQRNARPMLPTLESNLAAVAWRTGAWAEALERLDRALAVIREYDDPVRLARTLNNQALVRMRLGDVETAREEFEQALALSDAAGDREGTSMALGNLGLLHQDLEEYEDALDCFERSLALEEAMRRPVGVAQTLVNMGNVLLELERYAAAMTLYVRALEQGERIGSPVDVAKALVNIGVVQHESDHYEESIQWHERALRLLEKADAPEALALALRGLGDSQASLGRGEEALANLRRAVDLAAKTVRGLGEEEGPRAREPWADLFDLATRVALRYGEPADVLYLLEMGRAGTLLEALGARATVRGALVPDRLHEAEAAADRAHRDALAALERARHAGDLDAIDEAEKALDGARRRLADVAARIRRRVKAGADLLEPTPVTAKEASALLTEDQALVLLALTSEDAAALVIRPSGLRLVRLPPSEQIAARCEALALADVLADPAEAVRALRGAIADRIALDAKVKHVLVSPHGPLAYVPFALLWPERVVSYVPSATTLRELRHNEGARGTRVLALGDPDRSKPLDPRALAVWRRGLELPPLPGARAEAKAVGDQVLLGEDANEGALEEALAAVPRWRAVHLACHAWIDAERPMFSSLALTPTADDDGLLTVLEVFGLDIPADLVTLSACETAKGEVFLTEGIVGMTRAFMAAGGRNVLCSLWAADDEATRALMERFYASFRKPNGPSAAEALKEAQAWVRAQPGWEHPHFWAAWVLWGPGD